MKISKIIVCLAAFTISAGAYAFSESSNGSSAGETNQWNSSEDSSGENGSMGGSSHDSEGSSNDGINAAGDGVSASGDSSGDSSKGGVDAAEGGVSASKDSSGDSSKEGADAVEGGVSASKDSSGDSSKGGADAVEGGVSASKDSSEGGASSTKDAMSSKSDNHKAQEAKQAVENAQRDAQYALAFEVDLAELPFLADAVLALNFLCNTEDHQHLSLKEQAFAVIDFNKTATCAI